MLTYFMHVDNPHVYQVNYYAPLPRRGHKAMMLSDVCLTSDICLTALTHIGPK